MKLGRPKPWWYRSRKGKVMALCPVCSARVSTAMLYLPRGVEGPPDELRVRTHRHSHPGRGGWCEGGAVRLDLRLGTMVSDRRGDPTPEQARAAKQRADYDRAMAERWGSDTPTA